MKNQIDFEKDDKYTKYTCWLFILLAIATLLAYFYERWFMSQATAFPYSTLLICGMMIFLIRYSYAIIYFFKVLDRINREERARQFKNSKQSDQIDS